MQTRKKKSSRYIHVEIYYNNDNSRIQVMTGGLFPEQEELQASQLRYNSLYREFLGKCDELTHARDELKSAEEQRSEERERHSRQMNSIESQSKWYLKRLADRYYLFPYP